MFKFAVQFDNMKKLITLLVLGLGIAFTTNAAEGDTIRVESHQETHWDWNGNWYDTTQFPETGTYRRILMYYTMGCPSGGCSQWDYTTKIEVGDPVNDSTTQWIELVRIITPYAGDKNASWKHTWVIDVTDYAPVLKGERSIKAHYGGWQDGFTVTINFDFIEGTPPRPVLAFDQIYHGSFKYGFSNDPIEDHLVPTDIDVHADMASAKFRMVATGHSFGGNENCAEFCQKYFRLFANNTQVAEHDVWRDDCGSNVLEAQTGTWIYNRAGWCPGAEALRFDDEIGTYIDAGQTATINVDWEHYNYTGGAGFDPQYIIESQVFQYGDWVHANDAAIDAVLKPSMLDQQSHVNPVCNNPQVVVSNTGSEPITRVEFRYWTEGAHWQTLTDEWAGVIFPGESATIDLPSDGWQLFSGRTKDVFHVEITGVNQQEDENPANNFFSSPFEETEVYPESFVIVFTNNAAAGETSYSIVNDLGEEVHSNNGLGANESVNDTVDLEPGCYTMLIEDYDCDGLSFFNNSDGNGKIWIHPNDADDFFPPLHRFEEEFGCDAQLSFTVGYTLGDEEITQTQQSELKAYPNPASDVVTLAVEQGFEDGTITVYNQAGQMVRSVVINQVNGIEISGLSDGVYTARYEGQSRSAWTRFVVVR